MRSTEYIQDAIAVAYDRKWLQSKFRELEMQIRTIQFLNHRNLTSILYMATIFNQIKKIILLSLQADHLTDGIVLYTKLFSTLIDRMNKKAN